MGNFRVPLLRLIPRRFPISLERPGNNDNRNSSKEAVLNFGIESFCPLLGDFRALALFPTSGLS